MEQIRGQKEISVFYEMLDGGLPRDVPNDAINLDKLNLDKNVILRVEIIELLHTL